MEIASFLKLVVFEAICASLLLCSSSAYNILEKADSFGPNVFLPQLDPLIENDAFDDAMVAKLTKASCPQDTVPFYVRKLPKPCSMKHPRSCLLENFTCHEDDRVNVSICCGKVEGCPHGQPQINILTNRPVACYSNSRTNSSAPCQSSYRCQEKRPGGKLGFCCPNMPTPTPTPTPVPAVPVRLAQRPAPTVGCPWGTKVIRNDFSIPITCNLDHPSPCPGTAKCVFDSLDNTSKCCANDLSDGCPGGFRPMTANGKTVSCSPDITRFQACPIKSFCHWNILANQYQCCEVDNGCPSGMNPLLELNEARKCTNSSQCPKDSTCEFNSWRNQFQCCRNVSSVSCSPAETATLDAKTRQPLVCSNSKLCPDGSMCRTGDSTVGVCCSGSGRCPVGYLSMEEARALAISNLYSESCNGEKSSSGCHAPAVCLRAVDAPRVQFLCCLPIPQCLYSTESAYHHHDKPQVCSNSSGKAQCPSGYRCEESTLPSVRICCSSIARAPDPSVTTGLIGLSPGSSVPTTSLAGLSIGASMTTAALTALSVGITASPHPSSPSVNQELKCPTKYELQKHGAVTCDPQVVTSCNAGSKCLPANKPGHFVCCTPVSPLSTAKCTADGVFTYRQTDGPQPCNPSFIFTGCPQTHPLCLFYQPIGRHSCCRVPICPNGNEPFWTLGTTVPRHCGNVETGDCPFGYLCLYSTIFDASICCLGRTRMRSVLGANGHISPVYSGGVQEQRRTIALNAVTQYGDMGWPAT